MMRFATRVFLASSALSTAGVLSASLMVYFAAERLYRKQYDTLYRQRLELVARDFVALEAAYDQVALNAARLIREKLGKTKTLSREELSRLALELGVQSISLIDRHGVFTAGNRELPRENLFDFCPSYRDLVSGATQEQQTPLVVERAGSPEVSKYTMIPRQDRAGVVDVGIRFESVGVMLKKLAEDDSDIVRVTLKSPSGAVLGDVSHSDPSRLRLEDASEIHTQVLANRAACCECGLKGLSHPDQSYAYDFSATLSNHSLNTAIFQLRLRFAAIFATVLALALLASWWVSGKLVEKIQRIRDAMDEIRATHDYSRSLPALGSGASDEIDALAGHFNQMMNEMREAQKSEARAAIAAQVAHDIRSPLTSMILATNQLQSLLQRSNIQASDLFSALSNGISRVNGIVNRISGKKSEPAVNVEAPKLTLVDKLLFDVAQEHSLKIKRTQEFTLAGFPPVPSSWAVVQITELQAALSNLLNNAFEAVGDRGKVELKMSVEGRTARISVADNGVGIAPENLARVFEREFTSGKAEGSGLGLYQAKKAVEWCGGKIMIESARGQGTTVLFTIPLEKSPSWLCEEIVLEPDQELVVADDDLTILALWREKALSAHAKTREFQSLSALEAEIGRISERAIFVLDQYAGEGPTGLRLIESRGLGARACLSTSEFDDPAIQDKVKMLKARMIPKARLAGVRIKVQGVDNDS